MNDLLLNTTALVQRSPEWHAARLGSLGGTRVREGLVTVKSGGYGSGYDKVHAQIVTERLTGKEADNQFKTRAMEWGEETEAEARAAYAYVINTPVQEIGLVRHPKIRWAHASPDGRVGKTGLVEIKCPDTSTHWETLVKKEIPAPYIRQMLWQMACMPEIQWVDFVSYDNRLPEPMRLYRQRLKRDKAAIAGLEQEAIKLLARVDASVIWACKTYNVTPVLLEPL